MKITIIGSGAMGSLFGALLAESGQDVMLIDIQKDHVDAVNACGLTVESGDRRRTVPLPASICAADGKNADLVIVFVKSSQTREAAVSALSCLKENTFVLTLQNGLGNADVIAEIIDADRVIAGTTAHGATLLNPGHIRHAGAGPTVIGPWSAKNHLDLEPVKTLFCNAGIKTDINPDIHFVVWKKLIINIGINAITALTGTKNAAVCDQPPQGPMVQAAVKEACDVAKACGIRLPEDILDAVYIAARATGPNRSSMGQDVDARRPTEIDAINGAVVRLAKENNIPVPVNETLTALVRMLQNTYLSGEISLP